jgi:hypothetical protein
MHKLRTSNCVYGCPMQEPSTVATSRIFVGQNFSSSGPPPDVAAKAVLLWSCGLIYVLARPLLLVCLCLWTVLVDDPRVCVLGAYTITRKTISLVGGDCVSSPTSMMPIYSSHAQERPPPIFPAAHFFARRRRCVSLPPPALPLHLPSPPP